MHGMRRHEVTPFELQDGAKLYARQILHDVKNGFFVGCTARNIAVAFFAGDENQAKGFDFLPEGFVVHRLKPCHHIVSIFEFHREIILPDRIPQAQISQQLGGPL